MVQINTCNKNPDVYPGGQSTDLKMNKVGI